MATAAALLGIPLAIVLGVIAGLMRDKWPDVFVSTTSIVGMTLPGFVTATILIYVFAIRLEWFPAITLVSSDVPVLELLPNIVLPIITLTLIMVAHILRLVRTNMIDVMTSDYVQMAQLKGVPYWQIVFKHALPNAMLPTINVVALTRHWQAHDRRGRRPGSGPGPGHRHRFGCDLYYLEFNCGHAFYGSQS
jgi:peptide/nickel transport system permease protein